MPVSLQAFTYFEACAARGWIDLDELVEGCTHDLPYLQTRRHRVEWNVWAALCNRFETLIGSEQAVADSAIVFLEDTLLSRSLRRLTPMIVDPAQVYRLAAGYVGPTLYSDVTFTYEPRSDGRVAIAGRLPSQLVGSRPWMVMFREGLRLLTRLLGLDEAVVMERSLDAHHADLIVTLPPSHSTGSRVRRSMRLFFTNEPLLQEFEQQRDMLLDSYADIQATEGSFRSTLDALPAGVVLLRNGEVLYANAPIRDAMSLPGPITTTQLRSALRVEDRPLIDGLLAAQQPGQPPVVVHTGAGIALEASTLPGPVFGGEPCQLLYFRDITQQVAMSRQLAISERMVSMGTLAAGAAHEINNPLTYVIGNLGIALDGLDALTTGASEPREDLRTLLSQALDGADRIRDIVAGLRRFSQVRSPREAAVSPAHAIGAAIRLAEPTTRHLGQVTVCPDIPDDEVLADERQLVQALVNLIVNGAQAVASLEDGPRTVHVSARSEGEEVALQVVDSGPGIPQAVLSRIFDPFFTSGKAAGTGLGLSITHRLVESMGGRLSVASEPGRGSTFTIRLPTARSATCHPPTPVPEAELAIPGRIVVIDDDDDVRASIVRILARHDVVDADSLDAALPLLQAEPGPDLVLCDLRMPGGGGLQLYTMMAEAGDPTRHRLLFMTGAIEPDALARLRETGRPIVHKPFRPDTLRDTVEGHLAATRLPAELGD